MRKLWWLLISVFFLLFSCSKEEQPVAPDSPKIEISIADLSFPDEIGKTESFDITSNVPWKIALSDTRSVPGWLQVSPMSGGVGTVKVNVTVTEDNDSYDDRNAYIKIEAGTASKVFTVTQKKKDALILTQDKIEVDAGGGKFDIQLQTNNSYTVKIPEESAVWISRVNAAKTRALETKVEKFEVKEGTEDGRRQGMIVFESAGLKDTVHVFQAQKDVLILSENECYVSNEQAKVEIDIRANIEYDVLIPSDVTWIKQVMTRALRVDKLTLSVDANESYDGRSAQVVVKDKNSALADTLTVVQSQVNALILGQKKINGLSCCGEQFTITVKSNIDYTYVIPQEVSSWIHPATPQTKGLVENKIEFKVDINNEFDRKGYILFAGKDNKKDTLYLCQDGVKTILMDLYNATGGDSWKDNTNWGSDKPIKEWFGISGLDGQVQSICFSANNLVGKIPISIGKLKSLRSFTLSCNKMNDDAGSLINSLSGCDNLWDLIICSNQLSGSIPSSIGNLKSLRYIRMDGNTLIGSIPEEIYLLSDLSYLNLSFNNLSGNIPRNIGNMPKLNSLDLYSNLLTGTIPESFGKLGASADYRLGYNNLSGPIPLSVLQRSDWKERMSAVIYQRGYTMIPPIEYSQLPDVVVEDLNFSECHMLDLFAENKYTIIFQTWFGCGFSLAYTPTIVKLLKEYKNKGLGVVALQSGYPDKASDLNEIKKYIAQYELDDFVNLWLFKKNPEEGLNVPYFAYGRGTPEVIVVDKLGRVVYGLADDRNKLPEFIQSLFGVPDPPYVSTDFSKDGEILTLQNSTVGEGIDIVFMGDGFVDKDMETGGKYESKMKDAMENFFSVEPVKTFRNRFNVYCVKAVSLNEGIGNHNQSAFSTKYGEGTEISGDDNKCFEYALKVPSITETSNTFIVTVLNDAKYAGTCYMYNNNASIAYCPIVGFSQEAFSQIIHHEAVGHGFGKLADEYAYSGTIPTDVKNGYITQQSTLGWWNNVDFTNDPNTIRWNSFLNNASYTGQVGIYEGGCTYQYGVWRSTQNSIMLDNMGVFNAPSRQAIYKWIMELSGETYSMGKFLEYDAINRTVVTRVLGIKKAAKDFVPLAPPVVVSKFR